MPQSGNHIKHAVYATIYFCPLVKLIMGFVESFILWLVFAILVAGTVFATVSWFLGWWYPEEESEIKTAATEDDAAAEEWIKQENDKRRKILYIFIAVFTAIMMISGGATAYMSSQAQQS